MPAKTAARDDLRLQPLALGGVVPELQIVRDPADGIVPGIAGQAPERVIDVDDAIVVALGHHHRDGRHVEDRREVLLAGLQCSLRPAARLKIGEGE